MSEQNPKAKRQGHTFIVTAGPFKSARGVLQMVDADKGQLALPGEHPASLLWFAWEHIEEVRDGNQ